VVVGLATVAVAGVGPFVATLLVGRSALFLPSAAWLLIAAGVGALAAGGWVGDALAQRGTWPERLRQGAWPSLALLPATLAGLAVYRDETSHHFVAGYAPTRESLLAYTLLAFAGGQVAYWLSVLARRAGGQGWRGSSAARGPALPGSTLPPVFLAVAVAAYVNASLYLQWVPRQPDLLVNLRGARDLLAGTLPYHDAIPVWADRVHLLPVTLVLLFGPLAALGDDPARVLFFLLNQALWLLAVATLVRRLAPAGQRWGWGAAGLMFGATFWPWQEAIRFGQQDGLLILLFVISILAAGRGREGVAGLALGVALVVKPLSIWLPLIYLAHRRWRTLLVAGATGAVLTLATLPVSGLEPWLHFVRVEVPAMLPGTVRGTNIPLPSLHARMFVGREALGDGEAAPTLGVISALNSAANVLGLLLVAHLALRRPGGEGKGETGPQRAWLLDASLGLTLTLLLAPMAWQHYASWLTIAFFVLALPEVWCPLGRGARIGAGGLAGVAFLLLGLEDSHLLRLLAPLVGQWPAVLAWYAAGLLAMAGALAVARFARPVAPGPPSAP
jgi:Glycosyltransferase family 87